MIAFSLLLIAAAAASLCHAMGTDDVRTYRTKKGSPDGNEERFWKTTVPPIDSDTAIIELHGWTLDIERLSYTGWTNLAKQEGVYHIRPQGYNNSWYIVPGVAGDAAKLELNDLAFLDEVVNRTKEDFDVENIFLVGHSNGCGMAQKYAYYSSDEVTGVACHSLYTAVDVLPSLFPTPSFKAGMPIIEFHGTNDDVIPYRIPDTDQYAVVGGAEANMERWAIRNGCNNVSAVKSCTGGYSVTEYAGCEDGVVNSLVTFTGTGPQTGHNPYYSKCVYDGLDGCVDTTSMAWRFLQDSSTGATCEEVVPQVVPQDDDDDSLSRVALAVGLGLASFALVVAVIAALFCRKIFKAREFRSAAGIKTSEEEAAVELQDADYDTTVVSISN